MADLLQRERQLHRLNERFNSLQNNELHPTEGNTSQAKGDYSRRHSKNNANDRYSTYTRNKGPSTLLKKRGAGDLPDDDLAAELIEEPQQHVSDRHSKARHDVIPEISQKPRRPPNTFVPNTYFEPDDNKATTGKTTGSEQQISTPWNNQSPPTLPSKYKNKLPDQPPPTLPLKYKNEHSDHPHPILPSKYKKSTSVPNETITCSNGTYKVGYQPYEAKALSPKPTLEGDLIESLDDYIAKERNTQVVFFNNSYIGSSSLEEIPKSQTNEKAITKEIKKGKIDKKDNQTQNESLVKYLKLKIGLLEGDHLRLSEEMALQRQAFDKAVDAQKKATEQRDRALAKQQQLKVQLARLDVLLQEANQRMSEQNKQQTGISKDLEATKREVKVLTQTNSNLERRLIKITEELASSKISLESIKKNDINTKEYSRVEAERKDKQIKVLKKQRADLINAYKKQVFLIENLKRQNICLEQSKMVGIGEREFSKVLDWTTKCD